MLLVLAPPSSSFDRDGNAAGEALASARRGHASASVDSSGVVAALVASVAASRLGRVGQGPASSRKLAGAAPRPLGSAQGPKHTAL